MTVRKQVGMCWFVIIISVFGGSVAAAAQNPERQSGTRTTVWDCNIQQAIDNCVGVCKIIVASGTCNLASTLAWAGSGKSIDLECASATDTILTWPTGVIGITPDSYARIANCDLRGSNVSATGDALIASGGTAEVIIEGNVIEQAGEHGINTGGKSQRWTVRRNLIRNNHADGIFLASGTSDSIVADNILTGNASNGIDCNCSGTAIHGNISKGNGLPGGDIDKNGILISGILQGDSANYNSIVGNETSFNGGSGITIRADFGTTANYNVVSGNVSHDNGGTSKNGDGIQLDGSDPGTWSGNAIVGNTVYSNQRFGIEVDGQNAASISTTLISSNVSVGNGNAGILVGGLKVTDTLVVDNVVVSNQSAQITDLGSTRTVIAGNKENTSDSLYVIRGDLVANTLTSLGNNPIRMPNAQYVEAKNSRTTSEQVLLGLDSSNQTILRGGGGPDSLLFQTSSGSEGASMTDAGDWNWHGISSDGNGLKHQSVRIDSIDAGGSAAVTLRWATPFADGNYDPQCTVVDSTATVAAIRLHHIESFRAASVTALIVNDDRQLPRGGTLFCVGIHE